MKDEIRKEIRLMQILSMQTERDKDMPQDEKVKKWNIDIETITERLYFNIQQRVKKLFEL